MAVEKKNTSSGMAAAQRLINEMVANRTVGTDYYRSSKSGLDSTSPGATSGSTASKSLSADEYVTKRLGELGLTHRHVDNAYIQSFITDAGKYMNSVTSDKVKSGYGTISSIYASRKKQADDLRSRSFEIQRYLDNNKASLDAETYNSLKKYLDDFDRASSQSIYAFYKNNEFFSQFETEDDYNKYVAAQKDYEAKVNLNLDEADADISYLERVRDEYSILTRTMTDDRGTARLEELRAEYGELSDLDKLISERRAFRNQAKHIQEGITLSSVSQNDDFKEHSGYVPTKTDGWWSNLTAQYGMGYDDLVYEYINNQNGIRDEIEQKHRVYSADRVTSDGESKFKEKGYDLLTQDEIAIYNYYYSRDGKEAAQKYLDNIQETLNYRKATGMYENMEDETALELAFGMLAGYDQFESGITNLFNTEDDYIAPSAYQIASGMVREDLKDVGPTLPKWLGGASVGQVGYDAVTTTANMAPSIMSSIAANMMVPGSGAFVGNTLMFASSAGNAYQEALNLGYDKGQARAYSTMVGASEAGLQYLLGGIGSLGGTSKAVSKMLNGVDNAFIRTAAKIGGNMASEGLEEGLQEILTPWFKNLALHAGEDIDWSEVAYSSLLGALTAGFMEGPGTIYGEVNNYRTGKALHGADISAQRLADLGKTFSADTVAHQLAGMVNENTGAYTMGRLFNEIGATLTEQNVNDITQALVAKGITLDRARANARAMAVVVEGGNLTDAQVKIIEENDDLADAVRATIIDSNATWFQRTKGYKEVLMALEQEKTSGKKQNSPGQENTSTPDTADAPKVNSFKATYEASEDGKTMVDGKEVQVSGIQKNESGAYEVVIGENESTDGSNVEYASRGQALVFESYTNLDSITDIETVRNMNAEARSSIAMAYDPASNQDGKKYVLGSNLAFYYGYKGLSAKSIKDNVFIKEMTVEQVANAYNEGRKQAQADLAIKKKGMDAAYQQAKEVLKGKSDASKKNGGNHAILENGISAKTMTIQQKASYKLAEAVANAVGTDVHIYLGGTEQGKYEGTTGEIWLNINANHSGQSMMAFTLSHELVHMAKQWSEDKYQAFVDFLLGAYGEKNVPVERLIQNKIADYKNKGETLTREAALEEVICDSCQRMLLDTNAVQEMAEFKKDHPDIVKAIMDFVKEWLDKIRKAFKGAEPGSMETEYFSQLDQGAQEIAKNMFVDMVMDAGDRLSTIREAYGKGTVVAVNESGDYSLVRFDENTDVVDVTEYTKHSYSSLAEAAGFVAVEFDDGTRAFTRNGEKVTEVTVDDIENSPIGAFINFSLEQKDISKDDADRQKKMFAKICTMACKTNDFAMTMQFVGSAVFTGMKANADKQYGTTYDFPSICTKTQAVIDVMSAKMVKLGRGLNTDEITEIYREVFASGNPVPCPECYVFSRWIGIGGLLDNIKRYQDYYGGMSVAEAADAYRKMRSEIEAFAKEQGLTFGKAKGALTSKLTKEFNKLTEKIEKATNQGEVVKDSDRKRLDELEPMMNTVKAMTWLENVYFADSSLTKVNKNFRVPNEVLFDLNNGEAFATQYKNAWAFRTTQGAGYGKAITPYAEARLGEGILVTNNTTNTIKGKAQGTLNNYFLKQNGKLDSKARDALMRARLKQKNQAFIGGQRFQSTSDARYENASDYLLAALEMQAMHGMVQVYTKVDGAVPAFSAWNMSINQSLMPLGGGLDADGNVKDTSVGGMNPKVAFANRDKHETAGTITIGVNDNHIRAMFKQWVRDFIIPYHASGGKADVVADFRSIQEGQEKRGKMVRSTDYSRTQSDKVLSDDVLRWQGKTQEEIDRIHALREARIGILTRGKVNMDVVRSNEFLSALYDKLHDGEWDGVKLAKSKVESQIYPNEFWNQNVSYEDSAKITEDYLQYCEDLGFLHRFSGLVPRNGVLVPVTGYDQNGERVQLTDLAYKYDENGNKTGQIEEFFWKVLTDRRMYDNDGKYLPQKVVTLNDTTTDTVTEFAQNNSGRQYDKQKAIELAKKIAGTKYSIYSTFYSEFDAWDGKRTNVTFTVGKTSDALKSIGMKDQEIKMHSGMVISKMNKHKELTRDIFRKIPELLEHPIIVQFSDAIDPKTGKQKYDDSITVIGDLDAEVVKNGKVEKVPVLVALNLVPTKKNSSVILDFAVVKSAYTKEALQNYLNENSILYIDPNKKRTDSWLSRTRLSLPVGEIRYGSIRRIAYVDGKVKVQNRKHMSDMEKKLLAAGIIDEYGNYIKPGTSSSRSSSNGVSTRELLANAFDVYAQTPKEKRVLQEYRDNISKVDAVQKRLTALRELIKEEKKNHGDKNKIDKMEETAKGLAKLIDSYDRQLLKLEKSEHLVDVIKRVKSAAYQEAKRNGDRLMSEYKKAVEARFDRGVDSRRRTAMRHKINNLVNELNQYLLKGTKDRHVPIGLQKAVAEALNAVNMDTVGADERLAKLQVELVRAKTPEAVAEIAKKFDHVREMGDRMDEKLKKLKAAYDDIINSDDPMIANAHDDGLSAHMMRLIVRVGDTPLRDMTLDQLQDVYDVYKIVLASIRNANKSFKDNKNREISTRANQVMAEIDNLGVKRGKRPVFMSWIEKFGWDNLKPVYAMEHIGSRGLIEAYNNVRDGEDTWARDIMEAREFYLDKFKKYGYDSWDFEKKRTFTSTTGKNFELTLDQIMSLYAYSKRDQAEDHLKYGGIVFDPKTEVVEQTKHGIKVKYNVANATAYNISEETLADIISNLTPEQKSFADEMQDYLSTVMGAKGNEVSLAMYDVKLFREKHYFPLKSAHQYMARAKEQAQGDVKIKNSGFSKETKPHAKNPIVLSSFMDVWTNHVNEMSMYHAFVLPMEDFYRIYNYTTPSKNENMPTEGVTAYIENAYGSGATDYIDQMLKDLNGGARTDSRTGFINKMIGTFKKGAVFASLSVVVQQPSAIARAAALVDTKYFIGPKVDHKRHKALWEEVKRYAPVAIIKEMGYFDTNMGKSTQDFILGKEYSGFKEKMQALVTDSGYRDEVLSKAPALADEIAWCGIWEAVKRETKAKNPGIDIKSEAFLKKAGARFTEVITKTQVYDSVLARSANMRSKDTGMKMATAFMAEPTTSINMIADALLQGKRGNRKYCRAAIGAVIASQVLNSILVSFVYAARDDDEDESYWEKYVESLTGGLFDSLNPAGYIPFVKDIISIVQGYDVERSDMAVISDLWKAWQNLGNDKMSAYRKFEGFVGSIGQIFGLPAKNIMRDGRAIYQTVMSFVEGRQTTKAGIEYAVKSGIPAWLGGGDVSNQNQLYEAYLSGDKTQIARVESRFKDKSAVSSAIRKALRDNDPRIREAAIAWNDDDLDEYMRIAREIIGEKHFTQDDVVMAIRAEASALAPADDEAGTSKAKGLFTAEKFAEAISQGDNAMANAIRTDIIQTAQKNGKTETEAEKNFNSSAKGALEDMYLSGDISDSKAIDALVDYCGLDQDDAAATVKKWSFEADFGFAYSDMKDEFVAGKISASQAQNALMEYGGKDEDDAEKTVKEWEFLREYEFEWSDRGDLYKDGDISRNDMRTILINEGGMTGEEADLQIQAYDWQAQGYEGATMEAVREYNKHCASVNVPKDIYLHIRRFSNNTENDVVDGKPVSYSAMKRVMAEINAQRLTSSQKTAIARSLGWSEKNIRKYKLW